MLKICRVRIQREKSHLKDQTFVTTQINHYIIIDVKELLLKLNWTLSGIRYVSGIPFIICVFQKRIV